jgi:outer membrane protein
MLPFVVAIVLAQAEPQAAPAKPVQVLTLDEALSTADARQPDLVQAQETAKAAGARALETRGGLLPQLTGRGSYLYSWDHPSAGNTGLGTPGGTLSRGGWAFALTANQLIWDFGQTIDRYRASDESAQASQLTAQQRLIDTRLNVRSAYFTARAQKALEQVARETLANESKHLQQVEAFVKVGTQPEIALAQERTAVANDQFSLIQAENNYLAGKAALNQAIGVEQGTDYEVQDVALAAVDGEDQSVDALLPVSLAARPDYGALQRQVSGQQLTLAATRGGYWPSLSGVAGLTSDGLSLNHLGWNAQVGLTLNWELFTGLSTHYAVEEQVHLVNALEAQQTSLRLQIRLQLEQALLGVRAAKAGIAAASEALVNARERLRLAEGRFQQGVGSIIELGDAQVALTNAEAQRIQAEYLLSTARAQLLERLGKQ